MSNIFINFYKFAFLCINMHLNKMKFKFDLIYLLTYNVKHVREQGFRVNRKGKKER